MLVAYNSAGLKIVATICMYGCHGNHGIHGNYEKISKNC